MEWAPPRTCIANEMWWLIWGASGPDSVHGDSDRQEALGGNPMGHRRRGSQEKSHFCMKLGAKGIHQRKKYLHLA